MIWALISPQYSACWWFGNTARTTF